MKKLQLFDQNHGLSPLQKCQFCLLFKSMFIFSRKAYFLTRTSPNTFSGCILHKTKRSQNLQLFDQNHGLTPLQKCQFCGFLKPMFFLFWKACLLNKTSKIVFLRSIFTIYDIGIPGVTKGYRGLQGITRGYKGLQGLTRGERGDKGLQGVAKDYRNLFF